MISVRLLSLRTLIVVAAIFFHGGNFLWSIRTIQRENLQPRGTQSD